MAYLKDKGKGLRLKAEALSFIHRKRDRQGRNDKHASWERTRQDLKKNFCTNPLTYAYTVVIIQSNE